MNNESWYINLIEDIKLQESTGIVATKHAIGKRILQDFEKFGKPEYGEKRVSNIAKDCGVGITDIKMCITFARKYPTLVDQVDQLTWKKITHELLVENPREKPNPFDWFDEHTDSAMEAYALKSIIKIQKEIERQFGIIMLNEFTSLLRKILDKNITHLNFQNNWNND